MDNVLKILIIEDVETEVVIMLSQLIRSGLIFEKTVVDSEKGYLNELNNFRPDIILSDYSLPQFDGIKALKIRNELFPLIPFILVTGSVNEEVAVECIKAGADDYILKQSLSRLVPAIEASLKKAEIIRSRDLAEKALRKSEEIFSAFMEHSPVLVFFKDSDSRPIRLSRNYEQMLGMSVENAIGKTMDELFPSELSKTMVQHDLKVLKGKVPVKIIEELNGRIYETTKFPIKSQEGTSMLAGFTLDITENVKANQELIETKERFRTVFENTLIGLYRTTPEGKILLANPTLIKMLGYSDIQELKDRNLEESGFEPAYPRQTFKDLMELNGKIEGYESSWIKKDGSSIYIRESAVAIRDEEGNILFYEGSIEDITKNKLVETELILAKDKAEESDRLKTAFLHNISHEIRTPMNAIVGFSSMLEDKNLPLDTARSFAEIICRSSDQLLSIITDIVSIASVEAGQEKIKLKDVNLNNLLEALYAQYKLRAESAGLVLSFNNVNNGSTVFIETDETKLIQILSNLLNNAFKFTLEGSIEYGCYQKGEFLKFYVRDTGVGISPPDQKRVFERFFQSDNNIARDAGGTGLGLSISKAFVELLGGEITVSSEEGKGSEFSFTIPYKKIKNETMNDSLPEKEKKENKGAKTILIAEDDNTNFQLIEYILHKNNFILIRAVDGIAAVDVFKQGLHVDLVLMDIKMPRMDGVEATRQIHEINPDIPVIALTAYAQDSDRYRLLSSGFIDYYSKPFKRNELLSGIEKCLTSNKQL